MTNTIIVNATALKTSGALSILKQFVEAIPEDKFEYFLFVNDNIALKSRNKNIRFVKKNISSFSNRFFWDTFGVKSWLKDNNITPSATISLQNTNFRTNIGIPNFVYYHQAIPFFKEKWNPFKASERVLWFYKRIYPIFIKLHINKNTDIFVQTSFMKYEFSKYFHLDLAKIHIIKPKIDLLAFRCIKPTNIDKNQLNLIYPAVPFIYKNHSIIFKALSLLDEKLQNRITLYLTCDKHDIDYLLFNQKFSFKINFTGIVSFSEVLGMYNEFDALLFPSYIEAIGLPLLEAAAFGLAIVVADMPYAREVLKDYSGVTYAAFDDAGLWSDRISQLFSNKGKRYSPITLEQSGSWDKLFQIVKDKIF